MTASEMRIIGYGILLMAGGWVVFDWVTVGGSGGLSYPPWAVNEVRIALLTLTILASCLVALAFGRRHSKMNLSLKGINLTSATLMWACCTYTLWRCFQLSVDHGDNVWFSIGWVMEAAVALVTLRLWRRYR
jgi:hypothetical protein